MTFRSPRTLLAACAVLALLTAPRSAPGQERGAAVLTDLVNGMLVTPRVLVIAAHPDDEDTQLIAWLTRGRHVETAYLSLTRGDGGQNLIGNELGEALGAIRTEELLSARRVDGGSQFFTRAYDFGFSKTAEETFKHWPHEEVLRDVVTVIRAFRPTIIVAVFSGTPADGHGHHQVSGIVAREAYEASGDTVRFPTMTFGPPWEAAKFYRGARFTGVRGTLSFNVGEFDPVEGRSYTEIAGESRSQHRSQGFGVLQRRGAAIDAVARQASRVNESTPPDSEKSLFDGIDTSLVRLDSGFVGEARRQVMIARAEADSARAQLDLQHPERVVPQLAAAAVALGEARRSQLPCLPTSASATPARLRCKPVRLDADAALDQMLRRSVAALLVAGGVAVEATAERELLAFGDSMPVSVAVYNRGRTPVTVRSVRVNDRPYPLPAPVTIAPDSAWRYQRYLSGLVDTRPWWLGKRTGDMFADKFSPPDGLARVGSGTGSNAVLGVSLREEVRRESDASVELEIAGATVLSPRMPIEYRFANPVLGEQNRPVGGAPAVSLAFDRGLEWMPAGKSVDRLLRLTMQSLSATARTYKLRAIVPKGITVDSADRSVSLEPMETREVFLRLRGALPEGRYEFGIVAEGENGKYYEGFRTIEYPHIQPIRLYRSSALWLQSVEISVPPGLQVAYVQGVGDLSAPGLRQLGVPVTVLTPQELPLVDLSRFTTVIIGPRAYQASSELRAENRRLLEYVKAGGTMLVQYGQFEMALPGLMPYPVSLARPAQRVTLEDAPVTVLDARSSLLRFPNRIVAKDWNDWVQERTVYMPSVIDPHYATPLEMHDPGEPDNRGALLMARYGKGTYVYTTLALFRQFPAGVPGSAKLFVNLLAAGRAPAATTAPRVQP